MGVSIWSHRLEEEMSSWVEWGLRIITLPNFQPQLLVPGIRYSTTSFFMFLLPQSGAVFPLSLPYYDETTPSPSNVPKETFPQTLFWEAA